MTEERIIVDGRGRKFSEDAWRRMTNAGTRNILDNMEKAHVAVARAKWAKPVLTGNRILSALAVLVDESGMYRSDIERRSGVARSVVRDWCTGKRQATFHNLEAVLDVLGYELAIVPKGADRCARTDLKAIAKLKNSTQA